ncbi:MAG: sugar phosphate isomerase/epimerase family protein [Caldilineaceae bacterium]
MKLGVNLWTVYGWRLPEPVSEAVLRAVAALGSEAVELVLDEEHNSEEILLQRQPALSALLAETGMVTPSVASALFWRYNLASQDSDLRNRGIELIRQGCRVAHAFGAGVFLIVAGQQEPRTVYARSYETAVTAVRQAADYAADLGVVIGVENVGTNFICSPKEYAQFITDVDHPAVQAYLDFGNGMAVGPGYAENWVTALHGHIAMVHAKDYDKGTKSHPCCGQGHVAWEETFAAFREVGYDGYMHVETPPRGGAGQTDIASGLAAAETSLRWLARFA